MRDALAGVLQRAGRVPRSAASGTATGMTRELIGGPKAEGPKDDGGCGGPKSGGGGAEDKGGKE